MKKIISIILIIISINSVGCSSKNISNNEINKMKETIEKVLLMKKHLMNVIMRCFIVTL